MMSPSGDTQADVIEASNSKSEYLDERLNIDNPYFEGMHFFSSIIKLTISIPRPRF